MIIDERMLTFINSFDRGNSELLNEIEKEAKRDGVPIIRQDMQALLRFLLRAKRPGNVLEIGTGVGFSTLLIAENTYESCPITTIENYEKRIPIARENFKRAGAEWRISLCEGDAAKVLKNIKPQYDFIFMDAAKGQYLNFLPEVMRLLNPGGILVSDNVLQDGDLLESRYAISRRNRTIHSRMRQYLYELTHHPELDTSILPVGDGVTVSVRINKADAREYVKKYMIEQESDEDMLSGWRL